MPPSPFDAPGLPREERLLSAPLDVVYHLLDEIPLWPVWMTTLSGPAERVAPDTFVVRARPFLRQFDHVVRVTGRGPTHTLFVDIDDGAFSVHFRTRPQVSGTLVEVVVQPGEVGVRRLRARLSTRRVRRLLESVLDDLAVAAAERTGQ